jgi:colanic acid/amylovoran biosynthesis glycosyltransferase
MHVLHLCNSFLPITQNWVYSQIQYNTRCKSSVLCQYKENEAQFPHDTVYALYPKRSPVAEVDMLLTRFRARYRKPCSEQMIESLRPDIIHGHFAFESWRHINAIVKSGLPLVTTFYGLDINKLPRRKIWRERYKALFQTGAAFIVEGQFMAEQLAKLGCPLSKITCIPIGVPVDAIRAAVKERDEARIRILFTGLGREKKGALDAAAAFAAVAKHRPDIFLDLIGNGKYRARVAKLLKKAKVLNRCTFHGFVPVSRYLELLGNASIVLAPSVTAADGDTEGGAPVTVVEAQVAGIPVVGTLHCDIPVVVKNNETGLLCPERDRDTLTANLEKLVVDPELREKMGKAAAKSAAERHDIKRQVEKLTSVYDKVAVRTSR